MRLKKIKNAEEILLQSPYYKEPTQLEVLKDTYLEIGMGKGDFLIAMAKKYPQRNFIGIEKEMSVLVSVAKKLEHIRLPNLQIACANANELSLYLQNIETIYLNFSDPWPKNRHYKRRLTYKTFLEIYKSILKPAGKIILKTDNDLLFASSLISMNNYGLVFEKIILDLHNSSLQETNIQTEYEKKFSNLGFKIKYLEATYK